MMWIALSFLSFGLIARKLERLSVSGPMVFVAVGVLCGSLGVGQLAEGIDEHFLHGVAELTLILLLFGDAATIPWRSLEGNSVPARLLLIGLPLTILLGAGVGSLLIPALGIWGALLLGAILAPTDAALAQVMVSDERVPESLRTNLTVESGLNDGLALPAVMITAECLAVGGQGELLPQLAVGMRQLAIGPLAGALVGLLGAWMTEAALYRRWTQISFERFAGPALAVLAFGVAELLGGNGFLSAFAAGFVFGGRAEQAKDPLREFVQVEGEVLSFIAFFLFGALLVPATVEHWTWAHAAVAVLSLTAIRGLPVLLSLVGTPLPAKQKLLLAWFGPRGLASILFVLLVVEPTDLGPKEDILAIVVLTVVLSVLAHGVTAAPLARSSSSRGPG